MGDFAPYYLSGQDTLRQHFIDYFKTSRMVTLKVVNPVIRVFNDIGVVAFQYAAEVEVNRQPKEFRPGQAAYLFSRQENGQWLMNACIETRFVYREIGDPYGVAYRGIFTPFSLLLAAR